ncbi:MAG: hypothetical protein NTY09_01165 [bacterium]|nr:hypothetical protein [bacterium]
MTNENTTPSQCKSAQSQSVSSGAYGIAFIGAAIYFIQHATTFWMGVLGFLKAIIWPALVVYKVMEFFNM